MQPVHLTGAFYDVDDNLVDPDSPQIVITPPTGDVDDVVTQTAVKDSTGLYHYDYTPTVTGVFQYYFTGTGTYAQNTPPDVFTASDPTTTALISLADARTHLRITRTTPAQDRQLLSFIQSATAVVNRVAGYTTPTVFTETVPSVFDGSGRAVLMLSRTPVLSVATITPRMVGMPTIDITTLQIVPESGVIYLSNWFQWFGPQLVTYTAGRSVVPTELQDAVKIIVKWLWETQRGGQVAVPGTGGEETVRIDEMPGFPSRAYDLIRMGGYHGAPGLA